MAVIVSDTFTEASDTNLTDHTADTGGQWVQVSAVGTSKILVRAPAGELGVILPATSEGELCRPGTAPGTADYDVQITAKAIDTGSSSRYWRLHGRQVDVDNGYFIQFAPTTHTDNDVTLYKIVSGTRTALTSVDTGLTANDAFKLELRDAAKKVYKNGAEILSSADNVLTSAGQAGISSGKCGANYNGNANSASWRFDTFSLETVDAATGQPMSLRRSQFLTGARRIGRGW